MLSQVEFPPPRGFVLLQERFLALALLPLVALLLTVTLGSGRAPKVRVILQIARFVFVRRPRQRRLWKTSIFYLEALTSELTYMIFGKTLN